MDNVAEGCLAATVLSVDESERPELDVSGGLAGSEFPHVLDADELSNRRDPSRPEGIPSTSALFISHSLR